MLLISVADILRSIFSLAIRTGNDYALRGDCATYQNVRLASKRFKIVLDTLSVRFLLLSCWIPSTSREDRREHPRTLADDLEIRSMLHAPREVLRTFLFVEPEKRLRQLQRNLFSNYTLYADPTNKLFRYCVRRSHFIEDRTNTNKYLGCRVEYHIDKQYEQFLELFKFYLSSDAEIRLIYKNAVINLLPKNPHRVYPISTERSISPICRELFAAIGSLLPFIEQELAMKVNLTKYAWFHVRPYTEYEDKDNETKTILETEELEDKRLYLDTRRIVFRFVNSIEDETNMDPQYWSVATLAVWLKRVCYD